MPIQNQGMTRGAKLRLFAVPIDISAGVAGVGFVHVENAILVRRIDLAYTVATNATAITADTLKVRSIDSAGVTLTTYFSGKASASKALGFIEALAVASPTIVVPKSTMLLVSHATGETNTGEVTVNLWYQIIDGDSRP